MHPIRGIYALCDTSMNPRITHLELAERLLEGGVPILQLRMKGERDLGRVRATAEQILALKRRYDFCFLLNDYAELARDLPVDGLHGGKDDLAPEAARALLGPGRLIGYSAHSVEEAIAAERGGADYVAFGAIYPTASKGPGHPVQGIEKLRQVVAAVRKPLVAIGGIHRQNFPEVVATGVAAVAMIGALTLAPDITKEARWFVAEFQRLSA